MNIENILQESIVSAINELYGSIVDKTQITLQKTKKEFSGHYTLVTFPLLKISRKNPEQTAEEIGLYLSQHFPIISEYNVIKGFLNLTIATNIWLELLQTMNDDLGYGFTPVEEDAKLFMVEYSSPNTNKPLHLGHVRNNLLGHALSEVLRVNGKKVVKTNIVNDRGIHICKSMLAWKKWGNDETPESSGKKGDHLIGDFYVLFDQNFKKEVAELQSKGLTKEEAEEKSELMAEVREMLRKWEANDAETVDLGK